MQNLKIIIKNGFYIVKQHKIISQIHNSYFKNEHFSELINYKNQINKPFTDLIQKNILHVQMTFDYRGFSIENTIELHGPWSSW